MLIDPSVGNDPVRHQLVANITCFKWSQKGNYEKDCPKSTGTSQVLDQTSSMLTYSPPTVVKQTVTTSYANLILCNLVTILKELAMA